MVCDKIQETNHLFELNATHLSTACYTYTFKETHIPNTYLMTSVHGKPQKERTQPRQNSVDRDFILLFLLTIKALDNIQ